MRKLNVAIIGCGTIGSGAHLPGYQAASDIAEVVYFVDIIRERAECRGVLDRFYLTASKNERKAEAILVFERGISETLREIDGVIEPCEIKRFHGRDIQGTLQGRADRNRSALAEIVIFRCIRIRAVRKFRIHVEENRVRRKAFIERGSVYDRLER